MDANPLLQVQEARGTFLKLVLRSWIEGWGDVEGWRFEVRYDGRDDAVYIASTKVTPDGKIWTVRDATTTAELESAVASVGIVRMKAKQRYRDILEAVQALETDEGDE